MINMSHKTKSKTPRAMPVEAILTRNKLAQLKQKQKQNKLHNKVKLNAENELLRLRNRKRKISEKKVEVTEYQPDKVKRKMEYRKVMLKPKHNHTVIADMTKCNKRKLNVPKKDISNTDPIGSPSSDSEESVLDLITLMEGTQEMNDDDFLEILTCPSPVWWEEPPPGYTEDPISADYIKKENVGPVNNEFEPKINSKKFFNIDKLSKKVTKDMKTDLKYVNKSKKLEALLGNIKSKSSKKSNICDSLNNSDLSVKLNELKQNSQLDIKKSDICKKIDQSQNEIESEVSNLKDLKENIVSHDSDKATRPVSTSSPVCIELNSDETDQDDLMNVSLDDKTLFFLENIEIPIVQKP